MYIYKIKSLNLLSIIEYNDTDTVFANLKSLDKGLMYLFENIDKIRFM